MDETQTEMQSNDLSCVMTVPPVPEIKIDQLTVGRRFEVICNGNVGNFKTEEARLEIEENLKYAAKLLSVSKTDSQLKLEMTSYIPGAYQFQELKITDGLQTFSLRGVDFKFDSVIETKEGEEPPKPHGFSILELNWPLSYTLFVAACVLLLCVLFVRFVYKKIHLKNLKEQLKHYEVPLTPESQYYKTIRQLDKSNYKASDLERTLKVYLSRKLQIPFVELRLSEALVLFKQSYPLLKKQRKDLKLLLNDLQNLKTQNQTASLSLVQKVNHFVDELEELPLTDHKRGNP